jgi:hypothetical protein
LSGYILKDAFVGIGSTFWGNSIYKLSLLSIGSDFEYIPLYIKNIPLLLSLIGIFLGISLNVFLNFKRISIVNYEKLTVSYPQNFIVILWFFFNKWYFDFIYNYYVGYSILKYSYECFYKLLDKGFIEILGSQGVSKACYKISLDVNSSQLGLIYHLTCFLFLGLLFLILIIFIF